MQTEFERTTRRVDAIFTGYDTRAIVMLRTCSALLRDKDALQWFARARESYANELELLLLYLPPDRPCSAVDEPAASGAGSGSLQRESISAGEIVWPAFDLHNPLAAQIKRGRNGTQADAVTVSTWALCEPPQESGGTGSSAPPTFLEALCASRNVGWLLPFRPNTSIEQMAAAAHLDVGDLPRTVIDLGAIEAMTSATIAKQAHRAVCELVTSVCPPCGIALGPAVFAGPAPSDAHAWRVDAIEALLDEIANAVMTRWVTAFTRSAFSLRSRL
ncbi:hypothetical protein [Burkholderia sp. TSV86]|uniref:hypothetical protein n=1 Tax=Burkholderia sp. TSV86 TaxID=1385594 RepID=UPI00075D2F93|nr:hypothetical protein [Burkholderia sp. TSV86]KVE38448.1 hypothetical protein WS68_23295 [Burkholderia sp. TSV86]